MTADPFAALVELPGVPEAVGAARDAVDRLRGHRAMRRRSETVTAESLRRGAVAAAALETGRDLSPTSDQELLSTDSAGEEVRTADADEAVDVAGYSAAAVVRGAGRAYGELGALGPAWARSPLQVLARLHLLAAKELVPAEWLGRPRHGGVRVRPGPYDARLAPAPPADIVAARLASLSRVLGATRAPALVVAAVVHGEIATVRPFATGNHVVALAAQRIVLVDRGLDPRSQSVVEVGHLEVRPGYAAALQAYAAGTSDGVAAWVRHCGDAVSAGAVEGLAICESLGR